MILSGKKIADEIQEDLKKKIALLERKPGLAVVILGNHPASFAYVTMKKRRRKELACTLLYINCKKLFPKTSSLS